MPNALETPWVTLEVNDVPLSLCNDLSSVQFCHTVVSESLQPHELQHARPPYPSPTSRVYSNSCPLSRWHHPTISSSVVPFSSCLRSFPALRSFQMSQLFPSSGQCWSFSFNIIPSSEYSGLAGSPCCPRDSQESSSTLQFKCINSPALSFLYSSTLTSIPGCWKNHSLD